MTQSSLRIKSHNEPRRPNRLWLVLILGILAGFGPLSLDMYLPSLPHIAKELQTVPSLVQLSLTSCLLGLALGQLFIGPLSDIYGRRKPLIVGLLVYFAASLFCAFSPSIGWFIFLRFIQGFSGAAGIVISRAVARDFHSGPELTKFFSLLALVNGVAPILAPIFGGQLLRIAPWQGVFVVLSLIGFLMFWVILFGLPEPLPPSDRTTGGITTTFITFKNLLTDRSFIGYALSQGLISASLFAYISGSSFVLQTIYGASPQMFSLVFAMNGLGIITLSQVTGRLVDRVAIGRLFIVGLSLSLFGATFVLIALCLKAALVFVLIPLFFVVSSIGIVNTSGFSLALQNQGKQAGSASALLGVLMFILGGVASPLVGLGGQNQTISMGVVIFAASLAASFVYVILVARRKSKVKFLEQ